MYGKADRLGKWITRIAQAVGFLVIHFSFFISHLEKGDLMTRNRWGIAAAAVGIHICIGSVYAWSVMTKPIMAALGVSLSSVQWAFSIAIFFLGMSAAFFGSFVEHHGPTASGRLSATCFTLGLLGTALAIKIQSLWLLYLSYGCIGGIGLGIGYITPVSTLVKWFPKNRGFATGLAIMGFGFAALIAGPVMQYLYTSIGLSMTFVVLGLSYLVIMLASASYLQAPPTFAPEDLHMEKKQAPTPVSPTKQYSAKEALHTWRFYALWWMLFINITCGIGLLSVASPMAQDVVKMTAKEAAAMVGIIGLLNGAGRLFWASVSDYIGRANTYLTFFILEIGALYFLSQTTDNFIFQGLFLLIISCYGGGFSAMPAFLADLFGTKALSNIHGKILTAWAMAGIAGPLLISHLKETTSGYNMTLFIFSLLLSSAFLVGCIVRFTSKK